MKSTLSPKVLAALGALAVVGLMSLYALELRWLENTIRAGRLVGWSMGLGAALGAWVAYRLQHRFSEGVERMRLWAASLLFFGLFAPLFGSLSNRLLSFSTVQEVEVTFFEAKGFYSDRFGIIVGEKPEVVRYHLFVLYDDRLERLETRKPQKLEGLERGEPLLLPLKKGLWGYEVFVEKKW